MRAVMTVTATGAMALLLSGCVGMFENPTKPDAVVKIMATVGQCGLSEPGIHPAYAAGEGGSDFSPELERAVAEINLPPFRDAVVVSLGTQPTPGYSLGMLDASWFGEATLNVSMLAEKPSKEMVTAQVISTPCVILDVPGEGWSQMRVEADLPGFPVAWVRRDD